MAFKFKTPAAVGALIGSLALAGCGQDEKIQIHIKVGVIVGIGSKLPKSRRKSRKKNTAGRVGGDL